MATPAAMDQWTIREKLCLASSVMRSGDQNWVSVSRAIKPFIEPNRPADWFSQKNCAIQYSAMLEAVETPKRKRSSDKGEVETPVDLLVRRMTAERIEELRHQIAEDRRKFKQLQEEIQAIQSGQKDDQLQLIWDDIQEKKRLEEEAIEARKLAAEARAAAALKAKSILQSPNKRRPPIRTPKHAPKTLVITPAPPQTDDESSMDTEPLVSVESPDPSLSTPKSDVDQKSEEADASQPALLSSLLTAEQEKAKADGKGGEKTQTEGSLEDFQHIFSDSGKPASTKEETKKAQTVPSKPKESGTVQDTEEADVAVEEIIIDEGETSTAENEKIDVEHNEEIQPEKGRENYDTKETAEEKTTSEPEKEKAESKKTKESKEKSKVQKGSDQDIIKEAVDEKATISSKKEKAESKKTKESKANIEKSKSQKESDHDITKEAVDEKATISSKKEKAEDKKKTENKNQKKEQKESDIAKTEETAVEKSTTRKADAVKETTKPEVKTASKEESVGKAEAEGRKAEPGGGKILRPSQLDGGDSELDKRRGRGRPSQASRKGTRSKGSKQDDDDEVKIHGEESVMSVDDLKDDTRSEAADSEDHDRPSESDDASVVNVPLQTMFADSVPNSPSSVIVQSEEDHAYRVWRKAIMMVWRQAAGHKYASIFLHPVTNDIAPGYCNIVHQPMDLASIKKKIDNGTIRTTEAFQRNIMLMFQNAIMYNSSDHDVHRLAVSMQNDVIESIEEFISTQLLVQQPDSAKSLRGRDSMARRSEVMPKDDDGRTRRSSTEHTETSGKKRRTRADEQ